MPVHFRRPIIDAAVKVQTTQSTLHASCLLCRQRAQCFTRFEAIFIHRSRRAVHCNLKPGWRGSIAQERSFVGNGTDQGSCPRRKTQTSRPRARLPAEAGRARVADGLHLHFILRLLQLPGRRSVVDEPVKPHRARKVGRGAGRYPAAHRCVERFCANWVSHLE